jgi:hypothetical protein
VDLLHKQQQQLPSFAADVFIVHAGALADVSGLPSPDVSLFFGPSISPVHFGQQKSRRRKRKRKKIAQRISDPHTGQ